jgi:hypothetical protein
LSYLDIYYEVVPYEGPGFYYSSKSNMVGMPIWIMHLLFTRYLTQGGNSDNNQTAENIFHFLEKHEQEMSAQAVIRFDNFLLIYNLSSQNK